MASTIHSDGTKLVLAKIFMKDVFMALSWRFKPLRSGYRGSCFRLRRFYRIMLINLRFDNVHPVVPLSGMAYFFLSLFFSVFTVKLSRKTSGERKLGTSGVVLRSRFNYPSYLRLLLRSPTLSISSSSFIPLKYVLLLSALVPIMTPLSPTSFLCSWKNQSY